MRVSLLLWGVSSCVWFCRGPWGVAVAPPISPSIGPDWSLPFCRVTLELKSVFPIFPVRHSARIPGDHFVSFPASCVSVPRIYHSVQFLGHSTRRVTGLTLCPPPRSSRILSFALTYSHGSLILMHPAIDSVAVSLSPLLTVAMTPCNCDMLDGLSSWLAPYRIPHRVVSLSLPALDACCA